MSKRAVHDSPGIVGGSSCEVGHQLPDGSGVYFTGADICMKCKVPVLEHGLFMFNNGLDAIRLHELDPEWQPSPDYPAIPMDNGPGRVAYVWKGDNFPHLIGEPVVMVHDGPDEGIWVPCNAAKMPHAWLWICQLAAPADPADEDWMRSISS